MHRFWQVPCRYCSFLRPAGRKILLSLLGGILLAAARAQLPQITVVPGLPRQVVTSLLQDRDGYLWIGTRSGLFRYDGYEAVHFVADQTDSSALLNNTISSINEGPGGHIWVTTESGLSIYDPARRDFRSFFHRNYVPEVTFDETGRAWAVIGTRGLLHFHGDPVTGNLGDSLAPIDVSVLGLGTARTVDVAFDSLTNTVVLTGQGRAVFDRNALELLSLQSGTLTAAVPSPPGLKGPVLARATDRRGTEWVSTPEGLFFRTEDQARHSDFVPFRPGHEYFENNQITSLLTDRSGCLWVGSLRGIARIAGGPPRFRHHMIDHVHYQPEYSKISTLDYARQSERLWITTENSGVFTFRPASNTYEHVDLPAWIDEPLINSLELTDSTLWVSFDNSVLSFSLANGRVMTDAVRERSRQGSFAIPLLEVAPHEWWIGTWQHGLHRSVYPPDRPGMPVFDSVAPRLGQDPVYALLKDSRDRVWVGTRGGGIQRVQLPDGPVVVFNKGNDSGLRVNGILHLYEDGHGTVWAATRGGGVARFDEAEQRFRSFGLEEGLPDLTVCSIGETATGQLWVSTSNGLARYHPEGLLPFWGYHDEELFVNQDFSYQSVARDGRGHLYFGSLVGMTEVVPTPDPAPPSDAQVRLTAFRTLGDADEYADVRSRFPDELAHDENSFTLSVTSLNLTAPDRVRYAYRLAGLEERWNIGQPGERTIAYHEVPAGEYTLEIRNSDADGYWSEHPARFSFRVLAHPLLSRTALMVYGLLLLVLLVAGWLVRANWMRLRRKVARHRATIRRQNRQMIYLSDISHEMRNRLTLILGPLERVMQGQEVDQLAVQRIYQNALRLKQLSDRVMKLRRTEDGGFQLFVRSHALQPFLESVFDRVHDLALIRGIDLQRQFTNTRADVYFDSNVLEIILLNLLNNAIKYTPEGGVVELNVSLLTDSAPALQVVVRDTGIGIAKEELQQIFERFYRSEGTRRGEVEGTGIGLELVARLVNLHHGTIHLESEEGRFTEVKLVLPAGREFYESIGHLTSVSPTETLVSPPVPVAGEVRGTVLVVEDNAGIRELIRDTLQPVFHVLEAADGQQGLEMVTQNTPDLILSDLHMPELNGLELLRHVRARPASRSTPFLLLTGRYSESMKLDALQAGVNDIMEKPFSGELLTWRIKSLIAERNRLTQQLEDQPRVYRIEPSDQPDDMLSADEQFLQRLNYLMEEHFASSELNVEFLAAELAMSRPTLYRHMERLLQEAPANFIKRYRLKKSALLLQQCKFQVSEVAYMTGFSNPKYFSKCFHKEFGSTPSQYVKGLSVAE
ncbi:hybrid sensor histidine kinase/response regulator transcription factor [Lewinella sp. JB7]|uniref:hybrid sensor histidine kinase/response regulator transcription factor n=1 Tax=Lewinella sp. JB7 TaxID=2962887 RepID=UPI0020C9CEDC|nr:hybrid sensor histidine kinase/response regulator transcription factor [Lewinella sp. JB7]MCP9236685.1 ATP-binding protein [Lewinella sp. JB7]